MATLSHSYFYSTKRNMTFAEMHMKLSLNINSFTNISCIPEASVALQCCVLINSLTRLNLTLTSVAGKNKRNLRTTSPLLCLNLTDGKYRRIEGRTFDYRNDHNGQLPRQLCKVHIGNFGRILRRYSGPATEALLPAFGRPSLTFALGTEHE